MLLQVKVIIPDHHDAILAAICQNAIALDDAITEVLNQNEGGIKSRR